MAAFIGRRAFWSSAGVEAWIAKQFASSGPRRPLTHHQHRAIRVLHHLLRHRSQQQAPEQRFAAMPEDDQVDLVTIGVVDDLLCRMPYSHFKNGLDAALSD